MNEHLLDAIREFARSLSDRITADAVADVVDWIDHGEWLLALEVMADKVFESGAGLSRQEWVRLRDLVTRAGGEVDDFRYLEPPGA